MSHVMQAAGSCRNLAGMPSHLPVFELPLLWGLIPPGTSLNLLWKKFLTRTRPLFPSPSLLSLPRIQTDCFISNESIERTCLYGGGGRRWRFSPEYFLSSFTEDPKLLIPTTQKVRDSITGYLCIEIFCFNVLFSSEEER